jgi:hypothetical protein
VCQVKTFVIRMVCMPLLMISVEFTDTIFSVIAAQSIANIVKSSLGPLGLDKMLVDNIGVQSTASSSALLLTPQLFRKLPSPTTARPYFRSYQ